MKVIDIVLPEPKNIGELHKRWVNYTRSRYLTSGIPRRRKIEVK